MQHGLSQSSSEATILNPLQLLWWELRPKTLTRVVQNLTFWSNFLIGINLGPFDRSYFSLWNDSSWVKIGPKTDEISIDTEKLIKCFTFFQVKRAVFGLFSCKKLVQTEQQWEWLVYTGLKYDVLAIFHKKGSAIPVTDWKLWIFQEKVFQNFLHYITSLPNAIS